MLCTAVGIVHKQFTFSFYLRVHLACHSRNMWAVSFFVSVGNPSSILLATRGVKTSKQSMQARRGVEESIHRMNLQAWTCLRNHLISSLFCDINSNCSYHFFLTLQEEWVESFQNIAQPPEFSAFMLEIEFMVLCVYIENHIMIQVGKDFPNQQVQASTCHITYGDGPNQRVPIVEGEVIYPKQTIPASALAQTLLYYAFIQCRYACSM